MARKKKTKTKIEKAVLDGNEVKWQPGDERHPQGYWTKKYRPEFDEIASRLVAVGFNENNLANTFGITASALKGWKRSFPSFKQACNGGKLGQLRSLAANSMLEARGYDYRTTKTKTVYNADGSIDKTEVQTIDNHQPGNASLAMFIMCNLSNQLQLETENSWKSKQKVEVENKNLSINISAELIGDQIDRLAGNLLSGNKTKCIEAETAEQETEQHDIVRIKADD